MAADNGASVAAAGSTSTRSVTNCCGFGLKVHFLRQETENTYRFARRPSLTLRCALCSQLIYIFPSGLGARQSPEETENLTGPGAANWFAGACTQRAPRRGASLTFVPLVPCRITVRNFDLVLFRGLLCFKRFMCLLRDTLESSFQYGNKVGMRLPIRVKFSASSVFCNSRIEEQSMGNISLKGPLRGI